MTTLTLTIVGRAARNQATLDQLDAGTGPGEIRLYTAEGGTLLGVRTLDDPAGTINAAGRLVLAVPAAVSLAVADGGARWGELRNGDGVIVATGNVTDEDGNYTDAGDALVPTAEIGPWVLQGTAGTKIFSGGAFVLLPSTLG